MTMAAPVAADPGVLGPRLVGAVPAPLGRRFAAYLIDLLASNGLLLLTDVAVLSGNYGASRLSTPFLLVSLVIGLAQWRLHAVRGQTFGKQAMGLRTVAVPSAEAPGAGRTAGRLVLWALMACVPLVGLPLVALSVFFDPTGLRRGWHDRATGVLLVDLRAGRDPMVVPAATAWGAQAAGAAAPLVPAVAPVGASVGLPTPVTPAAAAPEPAVVPAPAPAAPAPAAPPSAAPVAPGLPSGLPAPAAPAVPSVPAPPSAASSLPAPQPAVARPAAPAPVGPEAGEDGIIAAVPGMAAPTPVVPAPPIPPTPPVAAEHARVDHPPVGTPASPWSSDAAEETVLSAEVLRRRPALRLRFDTGDELEVTGAGRIGRDPQRADEPLEHLVPLEDRTRSVSKTHLEFRLTDGRLWVRDLHSTNGSKIGHPGAERPLQPGEWVEAAAGEVVHLGSRTFTVVGA